jgi:hypothetical protein
LSSAKSERDLAVVELLDKAREDIGFYRRRAEHQAARAGRFKAERDRAREELREAVEASYYRGVADAMDALRAYDFPITERVDHIANKLAPSGGGNG